MYLAVRSKVRCTVCHDHEVFQNDYVGKHTKSKHKDLHAPGRQAPVTIELNTLILVIYMSPVIYESRNILIRTFYKECIMQAQLYILSI